jgi:WD40-like Beta Propeller Repeat
VALAVWLACSAATLSVAAEAATPCPTESLLTGASAGLPDCRAYEQVSPRDKGGFPAYPRQGAPAQASPEGEKLAFLSNEAFPGALGNTAVAAAHVSSRSASGWRTAEWTPASPKAEVLQIYLVSYDFSENLSQAVVAVPLVPLTPEATPGVFNLFLRHPDGTYTLVNSAPPAVPAEQLCSGPFCFFSADRSAFAGASSDFSHILFESTAKLAPEAPETGIESLYESAGGTVRLVGQLPDGKPAPGSTAGAGSSVGYFSFEQTADKRVEHAIAADGSRVVFQATADAGGPEPKQSGNIEVYDRLGGTETIELSAPAPGATPKVTTAEPATFWAATESGSRVFFTSSAELTTQSNTGSANNGEDLYEYNVDARALRDLTVDGNPLDASTGPMVQGIVDVSKDGSYVYFVADGQLVNGKGVDGQPNLYMVHNGGAPVFIATLTGSGPCELPADSCDWTAFPAQREAYVTPVGRRLAFMSTQSLPTVNFPAGYNNVDRNTGERDSEVYEYTAPTNREEERGEAGRLICASCDASGAQPVGNALIGGITEAGPHVYLGMSTAFHRVRSLSEDGTRLFYSSPAPLAGPHDRVYEYEQGGQGSCTNTSGCTYQISNGGGSGEADYFLDSDANGDNIFFATSSRLSPSDEDNLRDVYDARVNGGIPTPSPEVACESACRQPGSAVGLSASMPLTGSPGLSGNLLPPLAAGTASNTAHKCSRAHARRHGKCVKVRPKRHAKRGSKSANRRRRPR